MKLRLWVLAIVALAVFIKLWTRARVTTTVYVPATQGDLPLTFQRLTLAEALQSPAAFGPACASTLRTPLRLDNIQDPLPRREDAAIDLAGRFSAYLGILHAHTNASDAAGSVDEAYRYARDVARLDFFAVTDHPEYWLLRERDYYETQKTVAALAARPGFVPLAGFEYSSPVFGHYVVLNASSVHHAFEDTHLADFYGWLKRPEQRQTLVMFAHPGFHMYRSSTEFAHFAFDPALVDQFVATEVLHWNDYVGFLKGYDGQLPYIDEAIAKGWRVGAAASQDVHGGNWGTRDPSRIGLLLPHLDQREVLAALRARRFFATGNKDLQFAVDLSTRHGWAPMGSRLTLADVDGDMAALKIRYYDRSCQEWPERAEVVLDGKVVASYVFPSPAVPGGFPFAGELTLALPRTRLKAHSYLYARFFQGRRGKTYTESSPVFFEP